MSLRLGPLLKLAPPPLSGKLSTHQRRRRERLVWRSYEYRDAAEVYRKMVFKTSKLDFGEKNFTGSSSFSWESSPALPSPKHGRAMLRAIRHPETAELLDEGIVVWFDAGRSYTTLPTLELHLHGGPAILTSVLTALSTLPFCRPAERGEFTWLAFENGRMDLTEVEGLRDLIEAETEEQRRLAIRQAGGALKAKYEEIRAHLIECMALVEALIDFGEDEGIEEGVWEQVVDKVTALRQTISRHLEDGRKGEIVRSGVRVAIFGPPNAGKSSLLNWLAQRQAAIVSPLPGTTRDVIELSLDIGGFPVILSDTAGLRGTEDAVEKIGVERARDVIDSSHLRICLLSIPDIFPAPQSSCTSSSAQKSPATPVIDPSFLTHITPSTLVLLNKTDASSQFSDEHRRAVREVLEEARERNGTLERITEMDGAEGNSDSEWDDSCGLPADPRNGLAMWDVSIATGEGMQAFVDGLTQDLKAKYEISSLDGTPLVTQARHRYHLQDALRCLDTFLSDLNGRPTMDSTTTDLVLAAEELRYAAQAVGKVTGRVDVEEVLESIFSSFCIGK